MRIAYFDCFSGVSGDMALGALIAAGVSPSDLREDLALLRLPGWRLDVSATTRNGFAATDVSVEVAEASSRGRHLADIEALLGGSGLPPEVQSSAIRVFRKLADAEARVHATTPERIHFHEVGAIDAIIDVVGTCLALRRLGVEQVWGSPLPMGRGFVECAHGTIPLPGPAVVELTQGVPVYGVDVEGELVTPTGAALIAGLAEGFGPMPAMTVQAAGYGAGKSQFGNRPNVLRVIVGEALDESLTGASEVAVIETNIDDLQPQFYEVLSERLFEAGALDVFTAPVQMKKGRPATLLTVLARPADAESLAGVVFDETTTLGVRIQMCRRLCLDREWIGVATRYGDIRIKVGRWHGRVTTAGPEYEDVKAAARQHGVAVKAVHQAAMAAYERQRTDQAQPEREG